MSADNDSDGRFRLAFDDVIAQQQSMHALCSDMTAVETGNNVAELESTLDSTNVPAAIFETLAGSSVMLDLYDVFANPSAFPFPPEAERQSIGSIPMDVDPTSCDNVEQFGFRSCGASDVHSSGHQTSSGTCSPSSVISEHRVTSTAGQRIYNMDQDVISGLPSRTSQRAASFGSVQTSAAGLGGLHLYTSDSCDTIPRYR